MVADDQIYDDVTWYIANQVGEPAGPRLIGLCREMSRKQQTLISNTEKCIAIYQYGGDAKDFDPTDHLAIEEDANTFNVAQNGIDTVFSKVMKPTIAPMPLTEGGGYLQRHRAKQLGKALEGVLSENECDAIEEDVVMDELVSDHGAGAIRVIETDDCVKLEHIPIEDVQFDDAEVRQRQPRSMYYVPRAGIDKFVLIELLARDNFPGAVGTPAQRRAAIMQASNSPEAWRIRNTPESKHRVDYFESWHKPSGKVVDEDEEYEDEDGQKQTRKVRKHDGRHVIAVDGENGTLVDEAWEGPDFPILLAVARKRRRSIWGMSLMRDWIPNQREYEKITKKIQEQHQKQGVSGLIAPVDAQVNEREITAGRNGPGFIWEFEGQIPPQPFVIEPVAQGTYAYADSIARNMLERKGISTLAAASQLPAGLQQASGKALQVFEDFEDVRLLPYHRERERWKIRLCWLIIRAAKNIVARGVKYSTKYSGKHGYEDIDWDEVLEDAEKCVLRVYPVSALSQQPSARFDQLDKWLNAGIVDIAAYKRLADIPDLEAESNMDSADIDNIDRVLDTMVVKKKYTGPEPTDDFAMALTRAGKFYNLCKNQEVPEDRLQLILNYIEDVKSLKDQVDAAAAAKAAAAAAPPPGAPGPLGMPPAPPMPPGPPGAPPGMPPQMAA